MMIDHSRTTPTLTVESLLVAAVPFSPNLGDGIIARCLEFAIKASGSGATTPEFIDLAGRTSCGDGMLGCRDRLLEVLNNMPRPVADVLAGTGAYITTARKFRSAAFSDSLAKCRPVIIGGGHLLSDEFLNFPAKLNLLGRYATDRPAAMLGVGADAKPSRSARLLFARALRAVDLRIAIARDETTASVLSQIIPEADIRTAPDLGVLSGNLDIDGKTTHDIAISVASPSSSHYRANSRALHGRLRWWQSFIDELAVEHRVLLFTNGSPEDEAFKSTLGERCNGRVEMADTPRTPEQLLRLIVRGERLIAQRLHAILPATVAGVPVLAVDPNRKVQDVMRTAGFTLTAASTAASPNARNLMTSIRPASDATIAAAAEQSLAAVELTLGKLAA